MLMSLCKDAAIKRPAVWRWQQHGELLTIG